MPAIWKSSICAIAATLCITVPSPRALARVGLYPGLEIFIGSGSCSLGFLATNATQDKLAVTAGHCANEVDQRVRDRNDNAIGSVCHHTPDNLETRSFGATLICLSANTYISDAYFLKFGDPEMGDYVKKYGARTEKTDGKIVSINTSADHPWHAQMESTLVDLPGDSGSAWVGNSGAGPKLLGLNIGFTKRADGGYGFGLGYPIRALILLVKRNSPKWGPGFTPVGR